MSIVLRIRGLTRRFGKLTAVDDVSFEVQRGEIRGIIGPNGSGKTTLFNLISGFIKPQSGTIEFHGSQLNGRSPHAIAREGLVRTFQIATAFRSLSVADNIRMGFHLVRRDHQESGDLLLMRNASEERLRRILNFLELERYANTAAGLLPGGSIRVLSIGIAIAASPQLIMLDEPLAGLNASEKANVAAKIGDLRKRGLTVMLVEHDIRSVLTLCDNLTVLSHGAMIADGPSAQVTANPHVIETYIGSRGSDHA